MALPLSSAPGDELQLQDEIEEKNLDFVRNLWQSLRAPEPDNGRILGRDTRKTKPASLLPRTRRIYGSSGDRAGVTARRLGFLFEPHGFPDRHLGSNLLNCRWLNSAISPLLRRPLASHYVLTRFESLQVP